MSAALPDGRTLQQRTSPGALVYIEGVDDVAHARDARDATDHLRHFRLKNRAPQLNTPVHRVDADGVWMRHQASEPRPNPLDEHVIVHRAATQDTACACHETRTAVREIATHTAHRLAACARRVRDL